MSRAPCDDLLCATSAAQQSARSCAARQQLRSRESAALGTKGEWTSRHTAPHAALWAVAELSTGGSLAAGAAPELHKKGAREKAGGAREKAAWRAASTRGTRIDNANN